MPGHRERNVKSRTRHRSSCVLSILLVGSRIPSATGETDTGQRALSESINRLCRCLFPSGMSGRCWGQHIFHLYNGSAELNMPLLHIPRVVQHLGRSSSLLPDTQESETAWLYETYFCLHRRPIKSHSSLCHGALNSTRAPPMFLSVCLSAHNINKPSNKSLTQKNNRPRCPLIPRPLTHRLLSTVTVNALSFGSFPTFLSPESLDLMLRELTQVKLPSCRRRSHLQVISFPCSALESISQQRAADGPIRKRDV